VSKRVADPAFPDLIAIGDGPLVPCKVVELTATTVAVGRVEDADGVSYEVGQRYVIRYQAAPVAEKLGVEVDG